MKKALSQLAQGEKYFPWYHLNSRKTGHLTAITGATRISLLSSADPLKGDNSTVPLCAHTKRTLSETMVRRKLLITAFNALKIPHIPRSVNRQIKKSPFYLD